MKGQRRYKYLDIGRDKFYFAKKTITKNTQILLKGSPKLISSTCSSFVIDNMFVMLGGRVF